MEQPGESEALHVRNDINTNRAESPYNDLSTKRPGWTILLILACVSTTLGHSLPAGYNIGVVNTPAEIIRQFCNQSMQTRYGIVMHETSMDILWSFIVSVFLIGAAVGSLGGSMLANRIGRIGVLGVCSILSAVSALSFLTCKRANSLELLILGRILAGLGAGLTTSVVPMYLMELAPLHLKGPAGVLCPLGVTIGVLVGQIISMKDILGNENSWPKCLSAYSFPYLISAMVFPYLPESPKYLYVVRKQMYEALKELERLRNTKVQFLEQDVEELRKEESENSKAAGISWTIKRVVREKSLTLPLLLICSLQAGQQLSGINAVFFYSNSIFKTAGLSTSESELATIGTGIFNFMMAVISIPLMSNVNRRTCIQISMAFSIFFLVILGIAIIFIKAYSWVPYLSILGILGYVIGYGIGLGPIPYFVGSELFEVGPRPSAMALGSLSNWGANLIIGLTFPILQYWIGATCFFIFAFITTLLYIFIWFYLPETKGKDTYAIAQACQDGFRSRPTATSRESTLSTNIEEKPITDIHI